jgi:hypothetical protein
VSVLAVLKCVGRVMVHHVGRTVWVSVWREALATCWSMRQEKAAAEPHMRTC